MMKPTAELSHHCSITYYGCCTIFWGFIRRIYLHIICIKTFKYHQFLACMELIKLVYISNRNLHKQIWQLLKSMRQAWTYSRQNQVLFVDVLIFGLFSLKGKLSIQLMQYRHGLAWMTWLAGTGWQAEIGRQDGLTRTDYDQNNGWEANK